MSELFLAVNVNVQYLITSLLGCYWRKHFILASTIPVNLDILPFWSSKKYCFDESRRWYFTLGSKFSFSGLVWQVVVLTWWNNYDWALAPGLWARFLPWPAASVAQALWCQELPLDPGCQLHSGGKIRLSSAWRWYDMDRSLEVYLTSLSPIPPLHLTKSKSKLRKAEFRLRLSLNFESFESPSTELALIQINLFL